MSRNHHFQRISWPLKVSTWLVVAVQLALPFQGELLAAATNHFRASETSFAEPVLTPTRVTVNRTLTKVKPPSPELRFSGEPTDAEIVNAHVFNGPLISMGNKSPGENKALAQTLLSYQSRQNMDDASAIENFLQTHPNSSRYVSLLADLAAHYRNTGQFSKALAIWQQVWALGKDDVTDPDAKAVVDQSVSDWAMFLVTLGRANELQSLLQELEKRNLRGNANIQIVAAKSALWQMQNQPQHAFKCGPYALFRIRALLNLPDAVHPLILSEPSTTNGTSLYQIWSLAQRMNMNYQMARRQPGASIPLPALIHWKLGHCSTLAREENGRYLVQDPTFPDVWISSQVLDEEASGFFLIPNGTLPVGWSPVTMEEGLTVWGRSTPEFWDQNAVTPTDEKTCPEPRGGVAGMARYSVHLLRVSLNISDMPVGYQPPVGPAVDFQVTYNELDPNQSGPFNYSNLGDQWTFDWLSYVQDVPGTTNANVTLKVRGGGAEVYTYVTNNLFALQSHSQTQLIRTSTNSYERIYPDGSMDVFTNADSGNPRKIFLSQMIDAAGNSVTLSYDSYFRIVNVVDAIGQVTTVTYGSAYSTNSLFYKITTVTDPFGRYATFQYNSSGQLTNITDVIGLSSGFTYKGSGEVDFITSLTTPYGTTTFTNNNGGFSYRWIEITDPMGKKERVEFNAEAFVMADNGPLNFFPAGMATNNDNQHLDFENTFYWDKKAMESAPGDYSKAKVTHWLSQKNSYATITGVKSSEKQPLEDRVWYDYPGQALGLYGFALEGTNNQPSKVGRVLDDGSSQVEQFQYNPLGKPTQIIDPVGRTTLLGYATNNLDLVGVFQIAAGATNVLGQFTYNSQHLPLTSVDAAGQTNFFGYNVNGQLIAATNAINEVITLAYDTNGYLTNISGALPNAPINISYDGYGRARTVTQSDGYAITYDYDNLNRPTKITYPDGTFNQIVYDKLDAVLTKDRLGHWTRRLYDAQRHLTAIEDSSGRITSFDWCGCGSLTGITDPLGRTTTWLRDLEGRVTTKIYPDGTQLNYAYGANAGRLQSVTDANNQTTLYSYFIDNNLKQVTYSNAVVATPGVSFTYDTNYNRLLTMTDGIGTTAYSYYAVTNGQLGAGLLASVDGPFANDTITYAYDALGRITSRAINGVGQSAGYDALGRVTVWTNALGSFTNVYVGATGLIATNYAPFGKKTIFSYQDTTHDQRLQTIWNRNVDGSTLSKFDYAYDALGNITNWTQQVDNTATNVWQAQYDPVNQLLAVTVRGNTIAGTILKQYAYGYDLAGNRTSEQSSAGVPPANVSVSQSSYNSANQLTTRTGGSGQMQFAGSLDEPGTVTVNANAAVMNNFTTNFVGYASVTNGTNVIPVTATDYSNNSRTNKYQVVVTNNGVTKTITFDLNGNETNVVTATATNSYQFDAANRMVSATGPTNQSLFTYDGFGRRVQIIEKANGVAYITNKFIWDGMELREQRDATGAAVTKRFFKEGEQISGTNYYFTRDHLGSIREMVDSTGVIQYRADYDPYGRPKIIQGSLVPDFGYAGMYVHAVSGLNLTLYRAYDSDLGRWLSKDPLKERGGLNLYNYVNNNPINWIDPYGLIRWGSFWSGLGGMVAATAGLVALGFAEVATGGLATAGVVVAGISLGTGLTASFVEFGSSFDNNITPETQKNIDRIPKNCGELIGFPFGEATQNTLGAAEDAVEFWNAASKLNRLTEVIKKTGVAQDGAQASLETLQGGLQLGEDVMDTYDDQN